MTKSRHSPPRIETPELLEVLRKARESAVTFAGMHSPRSGYRNMSNAVVETIDELAWLITGDRGHFSARGHSAPPPPHWKPEK